MQQPNGTEGKKQQENTREDNWEATNFRQLVEEYRQDLIQKRYWFSDGDYDDDNEYDDDDADCIYYNCC